MMRKTTTTAIFLLCLSVFGSSGGFLYAESSTHVGVSPRSSSSSSSSPSLVPPSAGFLNVRRYDTTINSSYDDEGTQNNNNNNKKQRKIKLSKKEEYERRRQLWMERYGSLEALQSTFGTGRPDGSPDGGFFSGDLTPEQTRFLYHTLLPRSLLGLYEMELMKPEELAPLAYQARNAAKQYARSRCVWWGRTLTAIFDQYRNIRSNRGFGKPGSLSWEEIWSKYEAQIVQEACAEELDDDDDDVDSDDDDDDDYDDVTLVENQKKRFKEKDLTMRIYLRILERSCATNQAFDRMFLKNNNISSSSSSSSTSNTNEEDSFLSMGDQLEQDVREILLRPKDIKKLQKNAASREKKEMKAQQKEEKKQKYLKFKDRKRLLKQERREKKKMMKKKMKRKEEPLLLLAAETKESTNSTDSFRTQEEQDQDQQGRWQVMRILAGTRHKFREIL